MENVITLVTGNPNKLREAQMILGSEDLICAAVDLPELQEEDVVKVVEGKVLAAFEAVGGPVIVEDVSYILHALTKDGKGIFPGTSVKWWEKAGMNDHIQPFLRECGDRRATAIACVGYMDHERTLIFEGAVHGQHVERSDGEGWGFDYYFAPDGHDGKTFAQMGPEMKLTLSHRGTGFRLLRNKLAELGIML